MKPFLNKKTADGIHLIYKNEELLPFFDQDQLYDFHGGSKEYKYDPHEMWGLPKEGEEEKVEENNVAVMPGGDE